MRQRCCVAFSFLLIFSTGCVHTASSSRPTTMDESVESLLHMPKDPDVLAHHGSLVEGAAESDLEDKEEAHRTSLDILEESYRYAVVRIVMVTRSVNWLQPFVRGKDMTFIGSGFAVSLSSENASLPMGSFNPEDPVFVTNAHVVRNAHTVLVQMPSLSKLQFPAYVPLIYPEMDLAVVRLAFPQQFLEFLKTYNKQLTTLPVQTSISVEMGTAVAALGFPLGCERLKLSRGVIAGTEQVSGHVRYQSTAPISPGNSGGPLLKVAEESDTVSASLVGVNFAVASSNRAQNANYVVPVVHIYQLLHELLKGEEQEEKRLREVDKTLLAEKSEQSFTELISTASVDHADNPEDGGNEDAQLMLQPTSGMSGASMEVSKFLPLDLKHEQLKVATLQVTTLEGNDVLYHQYGCRASGGVFLVKLGATSALSHASPPIEAESFLYEVNGVRIDKFGTGATASQYMNDPIPFTSLMYEMETLDMNVSIKTCRHGENFTHTMSLRWKDEYELGVRSIFEPYFDNRAFLYESFANIFIMQLHTHHIGYLLNYGNLPYMGKYVEVEGRVKPRLVICHLVEGNYARRVLRPGTVISKLNGHDVSTLEDYALNFEPKDGDPWSLEFESGEVFRVDYQESLKDQLILIEHGMLEFNSSAIWTAYTRSRAVQELQASNWTGSRPVKDKGSQKDRRKEEELYLDRLQAEAYRRGYEKAMREMHDWAVHAQSTARHSKEVPTPQDGNSVSQTGSDETPADQSNQAAARQELSEELKGDGGVAELSEQGENVQPVLKDGLQSRSSPTAQQLAVESGQQKLGSLQSREGVQSSTGVPIVAWNPLEAHGGLPLESSQVEVQHVKESNAAAPAGNAQPDGPTAGEASSDPSPASTPSGEASVGTEASSGDVPPSDLHQRLESFQVQLDQIALPSEERRVDGPAVASSIADTLPLDDLPPSFHWLKPNDMDAGVAALDS
mmetsp:Transcript_4756/g.8144  ORF Transcript_4756/g.8144 Transcript_4756/m.8144 type:complete len:959 (+) Transcript_4756:108-2984(+)